jgi:hypothetical protein
MPISLSARIDNAFRREAIPFDAQIRMKNLILAKHFMHDPDTRFDGQIKNLRVCLASIKGGRPLWRPNRAPTYEAYLALLERTLTFIQDTIANAMDGEGHPMTLKEIRRQRALENNRRAKSDPPRPPLATLGAHWADWIPPKVRAATLLAFDQMYSSPEESGVPGRRIRPFCTIAQYIHVRSKWRALSLTAQPHIDAWNKERRVPGPKFTPIMRERYRAAAAAQRHITAHIRSGDPTRPVPIKWTDVLTVDERAHLREAEKAAGGDAYIREPDTGIEDTDDEGEGA